MTLNEIIKERRYDLMLLALAVFFPIYKYAFSSVILIVFAVVTIAMYVSKRKLTWNFSRENVREFFITTGYFLFLTVTLVYSANLTAGWKAVQYGLYIVAFPLVILLFMEKLTREHVRFLLNCFVVACIAYALYVHFQFYSAGLYTNFRQAAFNDLPFRETIMYLGYASSHPTYSSMWFLFSVLIIVNFMIEEWSSASRIKIISWAAIVVFLIGTSVLLSSKIAMVAFVISLVVLCYFKMKNKKWFAISFVVIVVVFVWAMFNVSFLKARFVDEYMVTEFKPPVGLASNSLNIRVGIYQCSFEIFQNNWLLGVGIGDVQDSLDKCYAGFDTSAYSDGSYNTHNNYLDYLLSGGIIAMILFALMLVWHLRRSFITNNILFIVFLVFIMVCLTSENILSRNHGVIFFSLIASLFIKRNIELTSQHGTGF